jgi:uncharacterized repeat protein (TIGR04076 family)
MGKIVEVRGECSAGHHVGEEFELTLYSEDTAAARRTPAVCAFLYYELFPYLTTLQFKGTLPWEKNKDRFLVSCPDNNKVVIEITRTRSE